MRQHSIGPQIRLPETQQTLRQKSLLRMPISIAATVVSIRATCVAYVLATAVFNPDLFSWVLFWVMDWLKLVQVIVPATSALASFGSFIRTFTVPFFR
jgi:hypothetical protein